MYYKGVNRGLSFTRAGIYAILLFLVLGFLAMVTGINSLFIFLSFGLTLIIISGVLSEKVMKSVSLGKLHSAVVSAGQPFEVEVTVANSSKTFTVFGVEVLMSLTRPPSYLMSRNIASEISGRVSKVPPYSTVAYKLQSQGMDRGYYTTFQVCQRTTYPFGVLEKFKISSLSCNLTVVPRLDEEFKARFEQEFRDRRILKDDDREFYSHRNYTSRDSVKIIDWKKSANLARKDWVVKVYKSNSEDEHLRIVCNWEELKNSKSQAVYEKALSKVRTVCEVLSSNQQSFHLLLTDEYQFVGYDVALLALARLPSYDQRKGGLEGLKNIRTSRPPRSRSNVLVESDGVRWEELAA